MNSRTFARLVLTVALLAFALLGLALRLKIRNTMVVANQSGSLVKQVEVTVCGTRHAFGEMKDGEIRKQHFAIKGDGSFLVVATWADGMASTNGFGYVTGGTMGYGNRAEIELTRERAIVGKHHP